MGGGGHDIHFGIYKSPTDGVKESSDYTTEWMMTQMEWAKPIDANCHVLDLGSGHGGGSHAMAKRWGCKVTGYNLGPGQNALNMARCVELGIDHLVEARVGNINDPLPGEWTGKFDAVWSCEVLCHPGDKVALRWGFPPNASSDEACSSSPTSWARTARTRRRSKPLPIATPPRSWADPACTSISSRNRASST